jgi:hypothetical protein
MNNIENQEPEISEEALEVYVPENEEPSDSNETGS